MVNYKELTKKRKRILQENEDTDFYYEIHDGGVLISIPHAVNQTRLGKIKYAEPGSVNFGLALKEEMGCSFIIKTQNNYDDVNFDERSNYKDKLKYIISSKGIKYVIDCHSLKKSRDCDINLGIRFGENIKADIARFERLKDELENAGFKVVIDQPFCANSNTIAGYVASVFGVWSIQCEVNSKITNESRNHPKLKKLVEIICKVGNN